MRRDLSEDFKPPHVHERELGEGFIGFEWKVAKNQSHVTIQFSSGIGASI